jgi:hypothetical protein
MRREPPKTEGAENARTTARNLGAFWRSQITDAVRRAASRRGALARCPDFLSAFRSLEDARVTGGRSY